ncbi:MAG TPA: hypothetical protein VEC56_05365, partial [Candidatus Krumholzibacteria bacterium]|nr:hypothetical protein [Candidatus Krumholzibacteria bacterium]
VQHAQATPVRPSSRTELAVPEALDRIILSCLAKNPDDRPASADALAEALAAIAIGEPWTTPRAHEWWERHKPAGAVSS